MPSRELGFREQLRWGNAPKARAPIGQRDRGAGPNLKESETKGDLEVATAAEKRGEVMARGPMWVSFKSLMPILYSQAHGAHASLCTVRGRLIRHSPSGGN